MKQVVYLTESDIRNMASKVLNEIEGYQKVANKSLYRSGGNFINRAARFINPSKAYQYDKIKDKAKQLSREGLAQGHGGLDTYSGQYIQATTKPKSEAEFKSMLANKTNEYGEKVYQTEEELNKAAKSAYNAQMQNIKQANYNSFKYENPTKYSYYETGLEQFRNANDVVLHYLDTDPQALRSCLVNYLALCSGNKNAHDVVAHIIKDIDSGANGIAKVKDYIMKYRHNDAVSRMCRYIQLHCHPATHAQLQQQKQMQPNRQNN